MINYWKARQKAFWEIIIWTQRIDKTITDWWFLIQAETISCNFVLLVNYFFYVV